MTSTAILTALVKALGMQHPLEAKGIFGARDYHGALDKLFDAPNSERVVLHIDDVDALAAAEEADNGYVKTTVKVYVGVPKGTAIDSGMSALAALDSAEAVTQTMRSFHIPGTTADGMLNFESAAWLKLPNGEPTRARELTFTLIHRLPARLDAVITVPVL